MTAPSNLAEAASVAIETAPTARDSRPLRLITCGSVDDGKSTLIGRLLWDTKAVKEDQAASLRRDSGKQNDLGLPDFALLLDGLAVLVAPSVEQVLGYAEAGCHVCNRTLTSCLEQPDRFREGNALRDEAAEHP